MMRSISKYLASFLRSEQGSALPFIGLGVLTLMGATGVAFDTSRSQIVQSRMQNALDAAGLAIGSEISSTNINTELQKYFYANFPAGYLGTIIVSGPTVTVSSTSDGNTSGVTGTNNLLNLQVAGKVPNIFMKMFGMDYTTMQVWTQITRQSKGLELVLVMDNTGSMLDSAGGGVSKLNAAKSATQALLDSLYGSNNSIPNLWVGVVPFSQAVNIGTLHADWLDAAYTNTLNWGNTSWGGCVEARANGALTPKTDITDDPPSVKKFRQYYYPCNTNTSYPNKWYGTNASSYNNCSVSGTIHYQSVNTTSLGPNLYCPQTMLSMVSDKSAVMSSVNAMQATGGTHVDLGVAWGWRMLSPRWRGLWGGTMNANSLPLDYNSPLMTKVMVLMTDGDNTLYGSNTAGTGTSYSGAYTGYGFTSANALNVTGGECNSSSNCAAGMAELNNRTLAACNAMKSNGIIIYAIALGTDVSSASQSMLQSCATSASYYFLSPTTNDLKNIFQKIGDSLSNLRISQ